MENDTSEGIGAEALELLRRFFGYRSFRPAQRPVIKSLLSGHDTVAVMPTGAGKSICFQIPAMLSKGVAIVFSPLISLMKIQCLDVLEPLFGQVLIPDAVYCELTANPSFQDEISETAYPDDGRKRICIANGRSGFNPEYLNSLPGNWSIIEERTPQKSLINILHSFCKSS